MISVSQNQDGSITTQHIEKTTEPRAEISEAEKNDIRNFCSQVRSKTFALDREKTALKTLEMGLNGAISNDDFHTAQRIMTAYLAGSEKPLNYISSYKAAAKKEIQSGQRAIQKKGELEKLMSEAPHRIEEISRLGQSLDTSLSSQTEAQLERTRLKTQLAELYEKTMTDISQKRETACRDADQSETALLAYMNKFQTAADEVDGEIENFYSMAPKESKVKSSKH